MQRPTYATAVLRLLQLATLLLGACASPKIISGSYTVDKEITERAFAQVRSRAAFELRCPAEQLQLVVLNVHQYGDTIPSQIGVDGCGQRGVYVSSRTGWLLNAESGKSQ